MRQTDQTAGVVCTFDDGDFDATQHFTVLHDTDLSETQLARIAKEMTDYLVENHRDLLTLTAEKVKAQARWKVGYCVAKLREASGMTLRELAEKTGIAFNHISRIEQGKYNVTIDTLAIIANALGCEVLLAPLDGEDIYFDDEEDYY